MIYQPQPRTTQGRWAARNLFPKLLSSPVNPYLLPAKSFPSTTALPKETTDSPSVSMFSRSFVRKSVLPSAAKSSVSTSGLPLPSSYVHYTSPSPPPCLPVIPSTAPALPRPVRKFPSRTTATIHAAKYAGVSSVDSLSPMRTCKAPVTPRTVQQASSSPVTVQQARTRDWVLSNLVMQVMPRVQAAAKNCEACSQGLELLKQWVSVCLSFYLSIYLSI